MEKNNQLFNFTLEESTKALKSGQCKPSDFYQALKKRAESVDPKIHAYINSAGPSAVPSINGGVLSGIPISLKDNISTVGWETTCASKILKGYIPPYDATVVRKLKEAGAYIFAKCNMDEFAFGSSTETSAYGPTLNPWNPEYVPGGSSGGSAASVAANEAICAFGSDTGGSIRQPAALCGIVGLKPTYGRVSRYGLVAFGSSLDQIGPFTKTVKDSALLMNVIAGHDPLDSTSAPEPVPDYTADLEKSIKGMKIGWPKEYFIDGIDPQVRKALEKAADTFKSLGATIKEISLPHTPYAVAVYYVVATAEASSNLARFDGVRFGLRAKADTLKDLYFETRDLGFGREAKRRILMGTFVLSSGYYDAYYLRAQKVRTLIKEDFVRAFKEVDLIMTPTAPTPAFKIGEKMDDPIQMYLSDIFTISMNLSGVPCMSLPGGFDNKGLPIGFQLVGNFFDESKIFRAGHQFEKATPFHTMKPKI